jgi:hypothetical protein
MASKQQQLREMMKKAQHQGAPGENLSAIEKARLLKALRKKQREEQGARVCLFDGWFVARWIWLIVLSLCALGLIDRIAAADSSRCHSRSATAVTATRVCGSVCAKGWRRCTAKEGGFGLRSHS